MNQTLEFTVIYALIVGSLTPKQVKPHLPMFSKEGKVAYQGVQWLITQGAEPPFTTQGVKAACVEALGAVDHDIGPYFKQVENTVVGQEIVTVLKGAQDKYKLLQLQQLITKQLAELAFDPSAFKAVIENTTSTDTMKSLAEQASDWEDQDDGATRIALGDGLRDLQEETRGVSGFWVIGGITGSGKSTLAWQLSVLAGRQRPVLYYDLENTAKVLYERTLASMDGDVRKTYEALRSVYVRTEPREVFREVQELGTQGLIVLDSIQKIPSDVHVKRETMEEWLAKLDRLKQDGHIVIVVSQLNRGEGNYKGTNDIEHTADFGIKLDPHDSNPLWSNIYIEKNRHGIHRGFLCTLKREKSWLWTQV